MTQDARVTEKARVTELSDPFGDLSRFIDGEPGALVRLSVDHDGAPVGAIAEQRMDVPVQSFAPLFRDVEQLPRYSPMLHRLRRDGDHVSVVMRFKIPLISVKFGFEARLATDETSWFELVYLAGEPRDMRLRCEARPTADGKASQLRVATSFDVMSLGWLVKIFLRHHPEIRQGIYPAVATTILQAAAAIASP
jgi:hypothetical protein